MKNIIEEDVEEIISNIDFSQFENKVVLITGASGLIGIYFIACLKHICKKINGIKVIATFQSEPVEYFKNILDFNNVEIRRGDITDAEFLNSLPKADYIIHAAGYGQPIKFMQSPELTLKLNTFTMFYLMDKLKADGHFLFISSSEVYSNLPAYKYKEEDIGVSNTTHPRACYIEGKRTGETICNANRTKGVKAFSARLAHTYGPGARKGDKRVVMSFIEKAVKGKIEMLDAGEALRTYCYVADAVEVMWNILLFGTSPIYNVAGKSKTSISNLANSIGNILKAPVTFPSIITGVSGAPPDVELDISKSESEFKKTKFTPLDEGLKRTISWYLQEYGIGK